MRVFVIIVPLVLLFLLFPGVGNNTTSGIIILVFPFLVFRQAFKVISTKLATTDWLEILSLDSTGLNM